MIKILFFIDTTLSSGGAEKVLRDLVNNMDQTRFQITVCTLWPEDANRYLVPGIRYKSIFRRKTRWNKLWFRVESALGLTYQLHLKDDYDIEVAYLECGSTKVIAQSDNKKAVKLTWVHCDLTKISSDPKAFAQKAKAWYDRFDKVVCVSKHTLQQYQEMFGDGTDAVVVRNTVDDAAIRTKAEERIPGGIKKTRQSFVTVGRMYKQKGYDRLLEAHLRLIQEGNDHDLWILGEGPERKQLEQFIEKNGLQDSVHLYGFQSNPYPFMVAADAVVCSSYYEGFSTMVTEALILGKPVVTTPCSGMDELLGDNEFGLITEDSTEGIYQGMKKLLDDPQLRAHYAQAAAIRGKAFSKEKLVRETEQFFMVLLRK